MADGDKFSSPPPRPACLTYSSSYGNNVDTSFLVIEFWWLYPRPSLNTIQWRAQNAKWYFKAHIAQNEWTLLLVIHGRIRKERALCWENSVNPEPETSLFWNRSLERLTRFVRFQKCPDCVWTRLHSRDFEKNDKRNYWTWTMFIRFIKHKR